MIAMLVEEFVDQFSITDELFRISRRLQDHIVLVVATEEWSSGEDMEATTAVMGTWRDEVHPRREVGARIIGVVRHRQWVVIGVSGGGWLGR
jgi:hypothetical protein